MESEKVFISGRKLGKTRFFQKDKKIDNDMSNAAVRKYVRNFRANLKKDKLGYFQKSISVRQRKHRTMARMAERFSRVVQEVVASMPPASRPWPGFEEFLMKAQQKQTWSILLTK